MERTSRRRKEVSSPPPQDKESEKIAIREVRDMMLSFQKMTKLLISRVWGNHSMLGSSSPAERQAIPSDGHVHRELEKVKLLIFKGTTKGEVAKAWLENMHLCFELRNYSSNQKEKFAIYQLKESALLWWRNLESQLGYSMSTLTWEQFEEEFRENHLSSEYLESKLNEFHDLKKGTKTILEYEA